MSSDVAQYLQRLRAHLRLDASAESDMMRELSTHFEDRVAYLVGRGMPERRAQQKALAGFGRPQTLAHLLRQAWALPSWSETALGAGAFVVMALVVGLQLWHLSLFAAATAVLIVSLTLYGLWLGRPPWFYPWAGAALTLPLAAGYIAFAVLHREVPALIAGHVDPFALAGIAGAALYFPVGLFIFAVCVLVAARRDWLDASVLLSPLPGVLAVILAMHHTGGLTATGDPLDLVSELMFGVYLSIAVATFLFLRAPSRNVRVVVLVATALLLLSGSTFLAGSSAGPMMFVGRSALLVAFLLSPALVARHA